MILSAREKKFGKCEACNKDPRVLLQIDSGQWLCQTCRRQFKQSNSLVHCEIEIEGHESKNANTSNKKFAPSEKQIAYARGVGFMIDDSNTRVQVRELLNLFESVKWYVHDVWQCIYGRRPKDCNLSRKYLDLVVVRVITDLKMGEIIDEIEMQREEDMYEARDEYMGERGEIELKCFKPPLIRDKIFRSVEKLLRTQFPMYFRNSLPWNIRKTIHDIFARVFG